MFFFARKSPACKTLPEISIIARSIGFMGLVQTPYTILCVSKGKNEVIAFIGTLFKAIRRYRSQVMTGYAEEDAQVWRIHFEGPSSYEESLENTLNQSRPVEKLTKS